MKSFIIVLLASVILANPEAKAGWSQWEVLDSPIVGQPAVASWGVRRLDIFGRDYSNQIVHRWFNGSWSSWEKMSLISNEDPKAVSWGPGRIDLFAVRASDGRLVHRFFQGSWSPWTLMGNHIWTGSTITVASRAPGRLDIFLRAPNTNVINHRTFTSAGGWTIWTKLAVQDYYRAGPSAGVDEGTGQIHLAALLSRSVRGNQLISQPHFFNFDMNSGWKPTSPNGFLGNPQLFKWNNTLGAISKGPRGELMHYLVPSSGWQLLSNRYVYSEPGVVSWGGGRIDIFARNTNYNPPNLAHIWYTP